MTENKRFIPIFDGFDKRVVGAKDNGRVISFMDMFNLLNELDNENKELKFILQDMGLLMSDKEVENVRDEIASKLIKPLFKGNGFDVDVNTENGFEIIPKGVNND